MGDPRQIELVIAELGPVGGKSVTTCGDRPSADEWLAGKALPDGAATAYRRTVARLNYVAQDRPDFCYSSKECCRGMAAPTDVHLRMLKLSLMYI